MSAPPRPEAVEHPPHYGGDTPYETIKVLEAWLTPEQVIGFCRANAIKYLSRAGKKSSDPTDDLLKSRWYIDREVAIRARVAATSQGDAA